MGQPMSTASLELRSPRLRGAHVLAGIAGVVVLGLGCHRGSSSPDSGAGSAALAVATLPAKTIPTTPPGLKWPVAPGWQREAFVLPPPFAPKLGVTGFEEVRLAPGFARPGANDFWSYAFVWFVEGQLPLDGAALTQLLETYYRGLCQEGGDPRFVFKPELVRVDLARVSEPATAPDEGEQHELQGTVDTLDCLFTGKPLTLHVRLQVQDCPQTQRRALLVRGSPQKDGNPIWRELDQRQAELICR